MSPIGIANSLSSLFQGSGKHTANGRVADDDFSSTLALRLARAKADSLNVLLDSAFNHRQERRRARHRPRDAARQRRLGHRACRERTQHEPVRPRVRLPDDESHQQEGSRLQGPVCRAVGNVGCRRRHAAGGAGPRRRRRRAGQRDDRRPRHGLRRRLQRLGGSVSTRASARRASCRARRRRKSRCTSSSRAS